MNYEYIERWGWEQLFATLVHELGHATTHGMQQGREYGKAMRSFARGDATTANFSAHANDPVEAFEGYSAEMNYLIGQYFKGLMPDQREQFLREMESFLRYGGEVPYVLAGFPIRHWQENRYVWNKIGQKIWFLLQKLKTLPLATQSWFDRPDLAQQHYLHPVNFEPVNHRWVNHAATPEL